jgi:hypothetical protein
MVALYWAILSYQIILVVKKTASKVGQRRLRNTEIQLVTLFLFRKEEQRASIIILLLLILMWLDQFQLHDVSQTPILNQGCN